MTTLSQKVHEALAEYGEEGGTALSLSHCNLTSAQIPELLTLIPASITALDLTGNKLGSDGLRAMAGLLSSPTLRSLNLTSNPLGAEGAQALAESLTNNLWSLDVSNCHLGQEGVSALAPFLAQSALVSLDLRRNGIDSTGADTLTAHLPVEISALRLPQNAIYDGAALRLVTALCAKPMTTEVNLWANPLDLDIWKSLAVLLTGHPNVVSLDNDLLYATPLLQQGYWENRKLAEELPTKAQNNTLTFTDMCQAAERLPSILNSAELEKHIPLLTLFAAAALAHDLPLTIPARYRDVVPSVIVQTAKVGVDTATSFADLRTAGLLYPAIVAGQAPELMAQFSLAGVRYTPDDLLEPMAPGRPSVVDYLVARKQVATVFAPEHWVGNVKAMTIVRDAVPLAVRNRQVPDMTKRVFKASQWTFQERGKESSTIKR